MDDPNENFMSGFDQMMKAFAEGPKLTPEEVEALGLKGFGEYEPPTKDTLLGYDMETGEPVTIGGHLSRRTLAGKLNRSVTAYFNRMLARQMR